MSFIAKMPGRQATPRDTRNCYMSDEEVIRRDEAIAKWHQVEEQHADLPAIIWWACVAIFAIVAFTIGVVVGERA